MKLESQVVSLDLAKKLKELNVKQESLFYWVETEFDGWQLLYAEGLKHKEITNGPLCSAFTSSELGKMLPSGIWSGKNNSCHYFEDYIIWNQTISVIHDDIEFIGATESDVRAKMLVYLVENKLVTL